jgi:hypothetical protein
MVVTQGLRTSLSQRRRALDSEQALVTDCLANVDRVIEMPRFDRTFSNVVDLRSYELDHVIDLSEVQPRHPLVLVAPSSSGRDAVIPQPPSLWRAPRSHDPRSAAATA